MFIGARSRSPHTSVFSGTTCIDRPSDRPCPSHSRDTDKLHMLTPPCGTACHAHVNSTVRSRDSYKTENANDGKAKSRNTRARNCEGGMRERPVNLFILALPCQCHHVSLSFTYVSFSRRSLHTNPFHTFLHKYNMCTLHSGQDLRTRNAYMGA